MNEKKPRVYRSIEGWREIFARQATSGVSVDAFCHQEGIAVSVYRRAHRKVLGGATVRASTIKAVERAVEPFVDLGSLSGRALDRQVRLELGGGVVLSWVRG